MNPIASGSAGRVQSTSCSWPRLTSTRHTLAGSLLNTTADLAGAMYHEPSWISSWSWSGVHCARPRMTRRSLLGAEFFSSSPIEPESVLA